MQAVEAARPFATYELTIKTQMGRGSTIPKGRINLPREAKEKTKDRVLVFAEGRQAEEAKRAGAEFVGGAEMIEGVRVDLALSRFRTPVNIIQVANGKYPATVILCTPALIRTISPRLGRILGPKGLMPSERRGTVTDDIAGFFRRIQGSSEWKGDKAGTIRSAIAKVRL